MQLIQEELDKKKIEITIKAAKISGKLLAMAMTAVLRKLRQPVHGKQSIKQLAKQNAGLSNIEIADEGLKIFEKYAKKYEVDFSAVRSKGLAKNTLIFFKGRDADAITAAFKEFSNDVLSKKKTAEKPSVLQTIRDLKKQIAHKGKNREKVRERSEPSR